MNFSNDILVLIKALLPGVDCNTRFTSSYERYINLEAPTVRVEIFSKNTGSPLVPVWDMPKAHIVTNQSVYGVSVDDVRDLGKVVEATAKLIEYWIRELK